MAVDNVRKLVTLDAPPAIPDGSSWVLNRRPIVVVIDPLGARTITEPSGNHLTTVWEGANATVVGPAPGNPARTILQLDAPPNAPPPPIVFERINEPAGVPIDVLRKVGVVFHETRSDEFLVAGQLIPRLDPLGTACELGVSGHDTRLLLAFKCLLAQFVPALVELTFVPATETVGDLMRRVCGFIGNVSEERSVGRTGLLHPWPFGIDKVRLCAGWAGRGIRLRI